MPLLITIAKPERFNSAELAALMLEFMSGKTIATEQCERGVIDAVQYALDQLVQKGVLRTEQFPADLVTDGWSREPNTGKWTEMGASAGITINPPPMPPELTIHQVADKLNELESRCAA